jgi:hypothetical protein
MKVAVVLHGHFRCFDQTWPDTKKNLVDVLNPDIFAFAWTDSMGHHLSPGDSPDHENHPGYNVGDPVDIQYINSVQQRLNPKVFITDQYSNHDEYFQSMIDSWRYTTDYLLVPAGCHRPKGCLSMVWSRSKIIKLMNEYEQQHNFKYDLVIVTRYDVYHSVLVNLNNISLNVVNAHGGGNWHPWDYWTAGPSELISRWGQQWDGMNELIDNGQFSTGPHQWQTAWFAHKDIQWQPVELGAGIQR